MVSRQHRNRKRVAYMQRETKKYKLMIDELVIVRSATLDVVMSAVDILIEDGECKTIYIRQLEDDDEKD